MVEGLKDASCAILPRGLGGKRQSGRKNFRYRKTKLTFTDAIGAFALPCESETFTQTPRPTGTDKNTLRPTRSMAEALCFAA